MVHTLRILGGLIQLLFLLFNQHLSHTHSLPHRHTQTITNFLNLTISCSLSFSHILSITHTNTTHSLSLMVTLTEHLTHSLAHTRTLSLIHKSSQIISLTQFFSLSFLLARLNTPLFLPLSI